MTETNAKPIEPTCSMCPSYPRMQAELDRLTAELKEKEAECERLEKVTIQLCYEGTDYPFNFANCTIADYGYSDNIYVVKCPEIEARLKEREGECERLKQIISTFTKHLPRHTEICNKLQAAESLAAARLADQEAIERHTRNTAMNDFIAFIKEWYENPCHDFLSSALCTGRKCGDCIEAEIRKKYEVD